MIELYDMTLTFLYNSKKGIKRDKNQDSLFIYDNENYIIFIVFDGVSSYENSYKLINAYKKSLKNELRNISTKEYLSNALFKAHEAVLKLKIEGKSTLSALVIDKKTNNIQFVNIGDSRIYLFTKQYIHQITNDDLLAGSSNIVTRCLGMSELSIGDFELTRIENGNNFLICTDGFYNLMEDSIKDFFTALNFTKSQNIKRKMSVLQRRRNIDDSTYIVIKNEFPN